MQSSQTINTGYKRSKGSCLFEKAYHNLLKQLEMIPWKEITLKWTEKKEVDIDNWQKTRFYK